MKKKSDIKILIVEDEAITGLLLKKELAEQGYTLCSVTSNYDKALAEFQKEHPNLLIMDIQLTSDIDGIELSREIRKFNPEIPIIFVTGYAETDIKSRALELKPVSYLVKPIKTAILISTINEHFKLVPI
ncbi:MAG: response regulator [Spirochaetales bacterium]|nr:response regulator [Spirochaetales bacterium]